MRFGSACGRTDVMTMAHSLHAVSGADGRFRIERVPANEDLRLHAWNRSSRRRSCRCGSLPARRRRSNIVLTPAPIQVQPEVPPGPPRDPREGDIH